MRKLPSSLRIGICISLLLLTCGMAAGTSILVRSSSSFPATAISIETYAGKVDAVVSSVKPGTALTVVLLVDGLSLTQLESINKEVLTLYGAMKGRELRLAVLQNGSVATAGPFASRARLKSAFEKITPVIENSLSGTPETVYDALATSAPQWGANWSRVLLIGNFPLLEPATKEYAAALMLRAFCSQHIRVSLFQPAGADETWLQLFEPTGGTIVHGDLADFSRAMGEVSDAYIQVDWVPAVPANGFVVSHSTVIDSSAHAVFEAPEIVAAEGTRLPTVAQYTGMQANISVAARLLEQGETSEADIQKIREGLRAALELNPLEPAALLTASAYNEKQKDYAAAARFRKLLVEVRPLDSAVHAGLGHLLLLATDYDRAEDALKRAIELNVLTPQIAEDLAFIHLARKDDRRALPYLEEALRGDPKRQDLWFIKAHAAERTTDSPLAIQSFEQGLATGGVHIAETGSLLRLYLGARQDEKARDLAKAVTAGLPPDAGIRSEFAEMLDELRQSTPALAAWKRVIEVQPGLGRAHYRVARLLLESGDPRSAERAADEGLGAAPKFAGLYLVRADALEKQGRMYDARGALQQGASAVPDADLLLHLASVEDSYGGSAADAYVRLAEVLEPSSPQRISALERGFSVSVRDADFKHAESFATTLESEGHPEFRRSLSVEGKRETGALVPGGLDALAFAAHAHEGVPAERFFVEYCRTLILRMCRAPGCGSKEYEEEIHNHFQRIAALAAFGKRDSNGVVITLSLQGKESRRGAEKILDLLGIKLRVSKGQVELDREEKKNQAKKQETASALAIDELGMKEALQAGKPYKLEIPYEPVVIYPSESVWHENFYASENEPGGFATAALRIPKMAQLYVGISALDRRAASELMSAVSLKALAEHYAELVYSYSAAFALQGAHASVPGGPKAESIWRTLASADPAQPGAFFLALLQHSDGRLLAYFFYLSQLDRPHQAFFTANLSRTTQFYKLFSETEGMKHAASSMLTDTSFSDFLRSIPLDADGHVDFPGSAEVWTVAKGRSSSETQTSKMMHKVSKAAAPDVEDELLLRLARTHYKGKNSHHSELENFLGVSRIDAHRPKPLDEQSALLLAQNYSDFSSTYAYFTDITTLGYADYSQFFAAIERFKSHPVLDANLQLGQLHSLVEWICLLRRRRTIGDAEAGELFRFVCDHFAAADVPSAYTVAALESSRAILQNCKGVDQVARADERVRVCLLGAEGQPESRRNMDFQRVLELQKVPSLEAMFAIYDEAKKLSTKGAGDLASMEKNAGAFSLVELPKNTKVDGKEKEFIARYDPSPVHKIISQISQKSAKNKRNAKDIEKLCQELLAALQPQLALALAGPVYAYFLRPGDLVVSEDPLLIRKHHYFDIFGGLGPKEVLLESLFEQANGGTGSRFVGGFAQFGVSAGVAAGTGWKTAGAAGEEAIAAQIAALRGTNWDRLEESDQRLVGLRTTVAREWITESAQRPAEFQVLSEETMGLLSLSRRADLLNGIEARNWRKVWDAVTLPDLFALGGKYLDRFKSDPWSSPSTAALRLVAASNDGSRLNVLGAVTYHAFGCNHPHLLPNAPYEEYERHMFPAEIAERAAEFKLFLVALADGMGVEPLALVKVAEPLAARAFHSANMTDARDWRSLMRAFASIAPNDLREALQQ